MQGMVILLLMRSAAFCTSEYSSCVNGVKCSIQDRLSLTCSKSLMPESTSITLSWLAAKRIAQEAADRSG